MKKLMSICFAIVFMGIISCNNDVKENVQNELSQQNSKEVLSQEIETALQHYIGAMKSLNVDSVVNCWSEEGRYISSKRDVKGKKNLTEWITPMYEDLNVFELKATTTKLELDVSEDIAVQVSEYNQVLSKGDGPRNSGSGELLLVWKKEEGQWKIRLGYVNPAQKDTIH